MAILSISNEFKSGATEIGQAIEKQLGYEFLSQSRIMHEASAAGKEWARFSVDYGQAMPTLWERYDWSFMGFMALIQSIILDHAQKDNIVIMSRGANYLLRGIPHILKIRIAAPLEKRIERIMTQESLSWETARLLVKKADYEITSAIQQIYGKKWDDPSAYEIRFDTSLQPHEQIIESIKSLLIAKDHLKTQEAQQKLAMKALAARIKARILINPKFLIPTLEVEDTEAGIVLHGVARSIKEHQAIEEEVKKISGDTPVTCTIHYRGMMSVKPHRLA
ncbi:MAG: cytidylate kinase-like family protein [Deltaproteobacteria bacterium]|nr:cytidylate kinase-like family protein [Deltaproteobacteria bacterium]